MTLITLKMNPHSKQTCTCKYRLSDYLRYVSCTEGARAMLVSLVCFFFCFAVAVALFWFFSFFTRFIISQVNRVTRRVLPWPQKHTGCLVCLSEFICLFLHRSHLGSYVFPFFFLSVGFQCWTYAWHASKVGDKEKNNCRKRNINNKTECPSRT